MSWVDTTIGVLIALLLKEVYDMFVRRKVREFLHGYRIIFRKVTGRTPDVDEEEP